MNCQNSFVSVPFNFDPEAFIDQIFNSDDGQVSTKLKNHKVSTHKDYGRWTIFESQIYLEVLKQNKSTKTIIKMLKAKLPNRIESQLRAHHQKMINKYGSIENILNILVRQENKDLLQINLKLSKAVADLEFMFSNSSNRTLLFEEGFK